MVLPHLVAVVKNNRTTLAIAAIKVTTTPNTSDNGEPPTYAYATVSPTSSFTLSSLFSLLCAAC